MDNICAGENGSVRSGLKLDCKHERTDESAPVSDMNEMHVIWGLVMKAGGDSYAYCKDCDNAAALAGRLLKTG